MNQSSYYQNKHLSRHHTFVNSHISSRVLLKFFRTAQLSHDNWVKIRTNVHELYALSSVFCRNDNEPRQFINYCRRPGVSRLFKSATDYNAGCDRNTKRHNANNYTNSISIMTRVVMLQHSNFAMAVVEIHLFILCVTLSTFEIFTTFVMRALMLLLNANFENVFANFRTPFRKFPEFFTCFPIFILHIQR